MQEETVAEAFKYDYPKLAELKNNPIFSAIFERLILLHDIEVENSKATEEQKNHLHSYLTERRRNKSEICEDLADCLNKIAEFVQHMHEIRDHYFETDEFQMTA